MATKTLAAGVTLAHGNRLRAETVAVHRPEGLTYRGGPENEVPAPAGTLEQTLQATFALLGMETLAIEDLSPGALTPTWRSATEDNFAFEVPAVDDQAAVVLLEQDGVLRWVFPRYSPLPPASAPRRLRRAGATPESTPPPPPTRGARFEVIGGDPATRDERRVTYRSGLEGLAALPGAPEIVDWALGKVRAYVLRIVGHQSLKWLVGRLEEGKQPGFVALPGGAVPAWRRAESLRDFPALPTDRPARILLFCHGTFSSTLGSFGGLERSAFLADAWKRYDLVVGYDHKTLSLDPGKNAEDLHGRLQTDLDPTRVHFDAVSFSRGALVYRSLAEKLAPTWTWERSVFVASPNGGTYLASPANWKRLVNLYTNLAVAAGNLLAPSMPYALVAAELIQGLGTFIKFLATEVVEHEAVPGLAAMNPTGPFVASLNQGGGGANLARAFTLASDFEATASPDPFFQKLGSVLLDEGLLDVLMGQANDLVIPTASSDQLTPGRAIAAQMRFGPSDQVHHLDYFRQPATQARLIEWLIR